VNSSIINASEEGAKVGCGPQAGAVAGEMEGIASRWV
jgi:hypothetical protein